MRSDNKTGNLFHNADVLAAYGALTLLAGATLFGIIIRYCLGDSFVWQEEVQLAPIIWAVFLGGRYVLIYGSHAAIDVIVETFPEKLQKLLSVLVVATAVIILCYVSYQGVRYIMQMVRYNRVTDILRIPYSLIYTPLPIECLTVAVQVCLNIYRGLTGKGEEV